MVRQVLGVYRVKKEELKPLHEEVRRLAAAFTNLKIGNIPREQNSEADKLANKALDG
jgi:ribonuclease HI